MLLAIGILLCLPPGPIRGQNGLPPGPGWTALGAGALGGSLSFSGAMIGSAAGLSWRAAAQHPFGVRDLTYREGWFVAGRGGMLAGLCWRQLGGDGQRITSWESGGGWARSGFFTGVGVDLRGLSATGCRTRLEAVPVARFRYAPADAWSVIMQVRTGRSPAGWADRGGHALVMVRQGDMTAGLGGSWRPDRDPVPVLFGTRAFGSVRLGGGLWGEPPAPGAVLSGRIGSLEWAVDLRWVPGFGTSVIWSVGSGPGSGP